ncbi:MAG: hypothetical protein H5T59_03025, partial [Anaerolineae bacterium]|nr:hypothetical protein [Anaerolineae bacterium]
MKRSTLLACLVLVLVMLGACGPQPAPPTAAPTPSPTRPAPATATPPPAPTPTPFSLPTAAPTVPPSPSPAAATPVSAPAGPLPRLLNRVDLSLPAGNAYEPHHLALDPERGLAYALAADCPGAPYGCIAQVNLEAGALQRVVPLPGTSYSPIAAAGRFVFVTYTDEDAQAHLMSLDVEDNRRVVDLVVGDPAPEILGLDGASGRLFVRRGSDLEVRNTLDLRVVAQARLPSDGWQMAFQMDPVAGRAYVATKGAVYGLQAGSLDILWTFQEGAWGQFTGLVLGAGGTHLYVEAEHGVLALDPLSGALLAEVPWQAEGQAPWRWSLVAADAAGDWLCLHQKDGARSWLEVVQASTGERRASLPLWGGEEAFAYDPQAGRLVALRRERHEIGVFRVGAE